MNTPTLLFVMFACAVFYFLPSILAWSGRNFAPVLAINLFLGWTLIGWVVALAWALKEEPRPAKVIVQQPAAALLCRDCGKYSQPGALFCSTCGAPILPARNLKAV